MPSNQGVVVVGVLFSSFLVWLWWYGSSPVITKPADEVESWLKDHDVGPLRYHEKISGIKTLEELSILDVSDLSGGLDKSSCTKLKQAVSKLDLYLWLKEQELGDVMPMLVEQGYISREQLCGIPLDEALEISKKMTPFTKDKFLESLKTLLAEWDKCRKGTHQQPHVSNSGGWTITGTLWFLFKVTMIVLVVGGALIVVLYYVLAVVMEAIATAIVEAIAALITVFISGIVTVIVSVIASIITGRNVNIPTPHYNLARNRQQRRQPPPTPQFSLGLYDRIRGTYCDVSKCTVSWNHDNNAVVGGSSVTTINLVSRNGVPYKLQTSDSLVCKVSHPDSKTIISHVVEPTPPTGHTTIKMSFTTRVSGDYNIELKVNGRKIGGNLIVRTFQPGPVDANKTVFVNQTAVIVVTQGIYSSMGLIPRDSFGNNANIIQEHLSIELRQNSSEGEVINPEFVVFHDMSNRYELLLKVDEAGHYVGCVKYSGQTIGPDSFTILCLNEHDIKTVENNVKKKHLNIWYEAHQVVERGKPKRVYCYISPRQLQVREYFMKIIPTRMFTCKVCPSTAITFHADAKMFTLDDGFQQPVTLTSPHRDLLGATFYKFVLKNIGGSEKFQDKQLFFYNELKKLHQKQNRNEIRLTISRFDLLESARKATKRFGASDWCRKFHIEFEGEEGLDWGGVSREFFELLCVELFDASNGLFVRFNADNRQALVHPNHKRPSQLKLKHFEFAGKVVGKCLYESAMENTLLVKARFTRSFLAQLIGLRIHYKYFGSDDPDLYATKVQYIKDNDVTDLGLVFAEEEFSSDGGNPAVVPLKENGADIEVTEENKLEYLNLLAQHRLARCVKEEIEYFLKGLNEIVSDNLLSIFDENELELLMCGMDTVSFHDLKEHCILSGSSGGRFQEVLSWFWTIVSSFTQEEMARLLQFVTGCSQLPPGGFVELNPRFTITSAPTRGRLPTAHTCFNQLCLPDYDSCEQFQSALMLALNEGAEGFGMI